MTFCFVTQKSPKEGCSGYHSNFPPHREVSSDVPLRFFCVWVSLMSHRQSLSRTQAWNLLTSSGQTCIKDILGKVIKSSFMHVHNSCVCGFLLCPGAVCMCWLWKQYVACSSCCSWKFVESNRQRVSGKSEPSHLHTKQIAYRVHINKYFICFSWYLALS